MHVFIAIPLLLIVMHSNLYADSGSASPAVISYLLSSVNHPPVVTDPIISGFARTGETLELNYNYDDPDGDSEGESIIVWSTNLVELQRGPSHSFVIPPGYEGENINAYVHPVDQYNLGNSQYGVPANNNRQIISAAIIIELNELKAFPTAQGAGSFVTGGRGGEVNYVSNRNARGSGSLFQALKDANPEQHTTIIFQVGGGLFNIGYPKEENLSTWTNLAKRKNITIAGESANALGGVEITNVLAKDIVASDYGTLSFNGADNLIMRYIASRGGWQQYNIDSPNVPGSRSSQIEFYASKSMIIDHNSAGWGSYGIKVTAGGRADDLDGAKITIQNSLWHESLKQHNVTIATGLAKGSFTRITNEDERLVAYNETEYAIDFIANAFIGVSHRQPANVDGGPKCSTLQINNYTYDAYGTRYARFSNGVRVDMINNLFEANSRTITRSKHKMFQWSAIDLDFENIDEPIKEPSIYIRKNEVIDNNGDVIISTNNLSQWEMISEFNQVTEISESFERNSPMNRSLLVKNIPMTALKNTILQSSGSGIRFNKMGDFAPNASKIDTNYINYAMNNSGPTQWGNTDNFVHQPELLNVEQSRNANSWDYSKHLPKAFINKHTINEQGHNQIKRLWHIQGYQIINNAGYTALEMWLAQEAGDFHMLAKEH